MPVSPIAVEEHFWTPELRELRRGFDVLSDPEHGRRLGDLSDLRIREMDDAGIAMQVISHVEPAAQNFDPPEAVRLTRAANDMLHRAVETHPTRFAALAALPTSDPVAAAAELERTVTQLGFKGAMIHGLTRGAFPDERSFWPVLEAAHRLDVPIYIHPATPHPAVIEAYYKGFPSMVRVGHGFTAETAAIATRLILSEVFDTFPRLQIILGHLGEGLPYYLWRIDNRNSWMKAPHRYAARKPVADYFRANFHVTTSGHFSTPAMIDAVAELGVDRVMFSVDYPFEDMGEAAAWFDKAEIGETDRRKIGRTNAIRLFKLAGA